MRERTFDGTVENKVCRRRERKREAPKKTVSQTSAQDTGAVAIPTPPLKSTCVCVRNQKLWTVLVDVHSLFQQVHSTFRASPQLVLVDVDVDVDVGVDVHSWQSIAVALPPLTIQPHQAPW
jgi:anti-sigma factor RsiW